MTITANKLAASVLRAKSQEDNNLQTEVVESVAENSPATLPEVDAAVAKPRTPRATRLRTVQPVKSEEVVQAPVGDGDHNGGQPVFPNRVWPD